MGSSHSNIHICWYSYIFWDNEKAIPNINTSILTKRLNELVEKWFITKSKKSEYYLSEQWKELMEWLKSLKERVIETGRDKRIPKKFK